MDELRPVEKQSMWVVSGLGIAGLVLLVALTVWLNRELTIRPSPTPADDRPVAVVNQPSRNASETTPCEPTNEPVHTSWAEALQHPLKVCHVVLHQPEPFPDNLAQFKNLRSLTIVRQGLTALPASIGTVPSLHTLVVADNALTALPSEIGRLQQLDTLILNGNPITHLPVEIGQLKKLRHLYLQNTPVSAAEQARLKSLLPTADIKF